jgi:sulfate adenylyltransferase subunit 2
MDALSLLESEAIEVLREVAAQFKNPVLLFSGGKDSLCLLHLSLKAFRPDKFPYAILHIDTGHNFPETLTFRDQYIQSIQEKLIVRYVEDSIKNGKAQDETGPYPSRNFLQTITLLDALKEFSFDAAIGGARRDEEKARSKERFFSIRNKMGAWDPKQQRPELWNYYNGHLGEGEQMRVFPLSNWTEKDVWRYIQREKMQVPNLYFSHLRKCVQKSDGTWLALSSFITPQKNDNVIECDVRFRTVGDMTCTSPVFTKASTVEEILQDIATSKISERGSRADDKRSENAMEERKRMGYF